jgi:hypothetical protein
MHQLALSTESKDLKLKYVPCWACADTLVSASMRVAMNTAGQRRTLVRFVVIDPRTSPSRKANMQRRKHYPGCRMESMALFSSQG